MASRTVASGCLAAKLKATIEVTSCPTTMLPESMTTTADARRAHRWSTPPHRRPSTGSPSMSSADRTGLITAGAGLAATSRENDREWCRLEIGSIAGERRELRESDAKGTKHVLPSSPDPGRPRGAEASRVVYRKGGLGTGVV